MADSGARSVDDAERPAPRGAAGSVVARLRALAATLISEPGAPEYRAAAVVGCVAAVLVVVRVPRAWNTIWAEDGHVWLSDAISRGSIHSLGLFWQGYLSGGQRLAVTVVAALPLRWAAPALATIATLITAFCAFLIYLASGTLLRHRPTRVVIALAVALLPIQGAESIANLACLQFLFVPTCFWLFLWAPRARVARTISAAFVAIAALSSVLLTVLLPLALLRFFLPRERKAAGLTLVALAALAAQFLAIVIVRPTRTIKTSGGLLHAAGTYVKQTIDKNLVGGSPLRHWLPSGATAVLSVAIIGVVVVFAIRLFLRAGTRNPDPRYLLAAVAIVASGVMYLVTATFSGTTPRYAVLAGLLLVGGLAVTGELLVDSSTRGARGLVALVAATAALAGAWSFPASAFRRSGPAWPTQLSAAERDCRDHPARRTVVILISPTSGADSWDMTLPCPRLR